MGGTEKSFKLNVKSVMLTNTQNKGQGHLLHISREEFVHI